MSDTLSAYGVMALVGLALVYGRRIWPTPPEPVYVSSWWMLTRLSEWEAWTLRQRESRAEHATWTSDERVAAIRALPLQARLSAMLAWTEQMPACDEVMP